MSAGCDHLPQSRYWPGVNARPPDSTLAALRDDGRAMALSWRYGLDLLQHGYYWEAHEVLEVVWLQHPPNSRERRLAQCLIRIANAALKHCRGALRARDRILEQAQADVRFVWPPGASARVLGLRRHPVEHLLNAGLWRAPPQHPPCGDWCGVLPALNTGEPGN